MRISAIVEWLRILLARWPCEERLRWRSSRSGDFAEWRALVRLTPPKTSSTKSPLRATRGICVGTEADCGSAPSRVEAPVQDLRVMFDLNSATLTEPAKENLDQFAVALQDPRLSGLAFSIDGYTDARGATPTTSIFRCGGRRPSPDYLQGKGVDVSKFDVKGLRQVASVDSGPVRRCESQGRSASDAE